MHGRRKWRDRAPASIKILACHYCNSLSSWALRHYFGVKTPGSANTCLNLVSKHADLQDFSHVADDPQIAPLKALICELTFL